MRALVTGASGFIGTYLVKELVSQGHEVVALCQPGSHTGHLHIDGVMIATGDVTDIESLRKPCRGQNWVFHCAAIVGGYGLWDRFFKVGVEGTQNMINVAANSGVDRFIHLSSISVYGTRPVGKRFSETTPFDPNPEHWNHYVRQKIMSENEVWQAHYEGKIQATAIRPSLALGPRDRNVVRRTLNIIRSPLGAIIGDGNNRVPCVVIDELVRAVVLSASKKHAVGKAYNLSGREPITQLQYLDLHASAAGLRPLTRRLPMRFAHASCSMLEAVYRLARQEEEPFCTRIALAFAAQDFDIDCALAVKELGWRGDASYVDAINRSVEWYLRFGHSFRKSVGIVDYGKNFPI
jgi:2-alkyl-3-oxoalkanoate reductase